ncbi:MAG: helicase-related protein, partial [Proteobacteria bacterium]|nr:helicase-related protein [Pseudomonadota bacterium]
KKIWVPLAATCRDVINQNRSTLFFTNSRKLAEKVTLKINEDQIAPLAYSHHGSLSREIRTEVEKRLKQGDLKAIVATSSLEMGIDIGNLDEVVMIQSPPSVASALQRIGRAGHRVGETSVGTLYPTHPHDFLEAAVLTRCVAQRDIEPLTPLQNPLDVLAQIIVSMTATQTWNVDDVFNLLRRTGPYRQLVRENFDRVVDMLAGRYAGSRVRELKPRLTHDRIGGTIRAQKGAVFALYNSGGTIPDRGYYKLRHADSGAAIGDLDEEFVWEATTGDTFTLGTQSWQIQRITHNDVLVRTAKPGASAPPFWISDDYSRSYFFSDRIAQFLEMADQRLEAGEADQLNEELIAQNQFEPTAADELVTYLKKQRSTTGTALPHKHHLLLELVHTGPTGYKGPDAPRQLVIHSMWGGQVNRPWGLALEAAWKRTINSKPEIHADDNAIVIQLRTGLDPRAVFAMVSPGNLHELLREALESSGFFGSRFREAAGRSLLLSRQRFNQRLPLWMSRLQAKKLMSSTRSYDDFPVLLETWRTCLKDEFELDGLVDVLEQLNDGRIQHSLIETSTPSPFAADVTFNQVNRYMYADDTPDQDQPTALSDDLIASAVFDARLRPALDPQIIETFEAKRQRRTQGYEPSDITDWLEWAKERLLTPIDEWPQEIDHPDLVTVTLGERRWLTHRECASALLTSGLCSGATLSQDPPDVPDERSALAMAQEILTFYGPLTEQRINLLLPMIPEGLLADETQYVQGTLIRDDNTVYICDSDNLEILLRMQRAAGRVSFDTLSHKRLPGFLQAWQGFGRTNTDAHRADALHQLQGFSGAVKLWLKDLLPARLGPVSTADMDATFTGLDMTWQGRGNELVALGYAEDLALLSGTATAEKKNPADEAGTVNKQPTLISYFTDPHARYSYFQIADAAAIDNQTFNDQWWEHIWSGQLSADTLQPLRQGMERKYALGSSAASGSAASKIRNLRRRARASSIGWPGNWSVQDPASTNPADPLSRLEDNKDRVRLLLDRYGLVNRELVSREMRWRDAFSALRVMELGGEVSAGYFFDGLSGPQFITAGAFQVLRKPHRAGFWMAAHDPASPCGLGLPWPELPQRRAGNYVSFLDDELALVIENSGRSLTFHVEDDCPSMDAVIRPLIHLVEYERRVTIETINGEPARSSHWMDVLCKHLVLVKDHKHVYAQASG